MTFVEIDRKGHKFAWISCLQCCDRQSRMRFDCPNDLDLFFETFMLFKKNGNILVYIVHMYAANKIFTIIHKDTDGLHFRDL